MAFGMDTDKAFLKWLQAQLDERGMIPADLARRGDIGRGTLSDLFSGRRSAGVDVLIKIADGLDLPRELVLREGGVLRKGTNRSDEMDQLIHELEKLPPEDQKEFLSYIRWKNNQRKKK
jgi:transcriptional regulator with XRE-family HTH domain